MQKTEDKHIDYGKKLASWEFMEFQTHERGVVWYGVVILLYSALLFFTLISANFLFTIILVISGITFVFISLKKPKKIKFAIYQDGITLDELFYEFKDLYQFWLVYDPPEIKTLYIESNGFLVRKILIPLEDQNPIQIREILLSYLKEDLEREDEDFVDTLRRLTKF